jgi:hypothetical protein
MEMPHSLRAKLSGLRYKQIISSKDYDRLCKALDNENVLEQIRAEIMDCLKALDEIEKSGLNIYLPNEISGRRLTYQQCLEFIDKYRKEQE